VYTHGSGKRWLLAVAGSRMGHHLQGEVHGGMTLVFACRGPPGCSEQGYFTAVWLPVGRGFPGGFFRMAVLRRPEPALLIERLSHPSKSRSPFRCSWALGRARGTRMPRPAPIRTLGLFSSLERMRPLPVLLVYVLAA
jgi:hypothetical protein